MPDSTPDAMLDFSYTTDFANRPPFPDGVQMAAIRRISLPGLLCQSPSLRAGLLSACTTSSFFYLGLRGASGSGFAVCHNLW
jgi:hypothetical protein